MGGSFKGTPQSYYSRKQTLTLRFQPVRDVWCPLSGPKRGGGVKRLTRFRSPPPTTGSGGLEWRSSTSSTVLNRGEAREPPPLPCINPRRDRRKGGYNGPPKCQPRQSYGIPSTDPKDSPKGTPQKRAGMVHKHCNRQGKSGGTVPKGKSALVFRMMMITENANHMDYRVSLRPSSKQVPSNPSSNRV